MTAAKQVAFVLDGLRTTPPRGRDGWGESSAEDSCTGDVAGYETVTVPFM